MADTTYVQQLRKTISGEFYFGAMCHETKRRIAISPDASRGKQRYSQSGETIVSCHHCQKEHRFDNRDIFFSASRMGMTISLVTRHDKGRQRRPPTEAANIKGPA
jgi:hypothetical protein